MRIRIGYAYLDRLLSYPDVRYLSGCCLPIRMLLTYPDVSWRPVATASYVGVTAPACASQQSRPRHGPLPGCVPHLGLLPSGVTPLRWVLHHFGGGVMLPNWCNAPQLVHDLQDSAAILPSGTRPDWAAALSSRSPARPRPRRCPPRWWHPRVNENGGRHPPTPACRFPTPGRRRGLAA